MKKNESKKQTCNPLIFVIKSCSNVSFLTALVLLCSMIGRAQSVPPSPPTGLSATAASCGQVDLSWNASTDNSGTGLKAYTVTRSDGVKTSIGASRTTFSDANNVKSSTALTFTVVAQDNAGNISSPSNSFSVTTPSCPTSAGEVVVDSAYMEPLGKSMATYGARAAVIYQKWNTDFSSKDTWVYIHDSDTGQTSRVLLHALSGYQRETDYVLTSATDLWTLSCDASVSGKLLVSQYKLNGSPATSATLISTQSLGDAYSYGMSMIPLQSGGLMVAWNEYSINYTGSLVTGYGYRSPTGNWSVQFPVTLGSPGITKSHMAMAQHPADGSVWAFMKVDSSHAIMALHFTEGLNSITLDSINSTFITQTADGDNGPEGEFPFLTATADPTRNAILLAYQSRPYQSVYIDPLYGSMNSIFLKQAYATIAEIGAGGTKTFIPFQTYLERLTQFGMSVLSDGTIWLAYQPINPQTLTWNEVYASKYQGGAWSPRVLVGLNYNNYNNAGGLGYDPGALIHHIDQPEVAFMTPDQKIHTFDLSNLNPAPADTVVPATTITSPVSGSTVSGTVTVSASASDNVGVSKVELWIDASLTGTVNASPYNFAWNTAATANGTHTLQTKAYDAAGNVGTSTTVSVTVSNPLPSNLTVAITNPTNGGSVPRNQKVTLTATTTDTTAVTKVEFYVNNTLLGASTTTPYKYVWKVPAKQGVPYGIKAKGYDASGNTASQSITVTAQ
jgi:hypothetical protein